jgi:hypothetical protein
MSGFWHGIFTDSDGNWDVAYVSLFGVMMATVGPIAVMTIMGVVAHLRCVPHEVIAKASEQVTVVACVYDPQPLGVAIGAAAGGFGVALGALAAYMAMTRRPTPSTIKTESSVTTTQTQP